MTGTLMGRAISDRERNQPSECRFLPPPDEMLGESDMNDWLEGRAWSLRSWSNDLGPRAADLRRSFSRAFCALSVRW